MTGKLVAFFAVDQPLVDMLASLVAKLWDNPGANVLGDLALPEFELLSKLVDIRDEDLEAWRRTT